MTVVTCRDCGKKRDVEPVMWRGRNVIPMNSRCDECSEKEDQRELEAARRDAWLNNRNRSLMPQHLWKPDRPAAEVVPTLQRWITGEETLVVLIGPVGVGKTFAAAWAAERAWFRRQVRWVGVARAMGQLRASFGDEDRAEALRSFTGDGSAVLDDIDKVPATETGLANLFSAIDSRLASGSPLLVTANSSLGELASKIEQRKGGQLGEAIASRLAGGTVLRMDGDDRRLAA